MMTREESVFLILCAVNLFAAVCYLLWGCLVYVPGKELLRKDEPDIVYDGRGTFVIRFCVMLLCPVVGLCFFLTGRIIYTVLYSRDTDLTDVIFKKDRVRQFLKDDEEKEHNLAPMEETILLGDKKDERSLIMNVIERELSSSLPSMLMALGSEDPETSHYAASALQEFFSDFRAVTLKLLEGIGTESENEYGYEEMLIDHMREPLKQNVFTGVEQKKYADIFGKTAEELYRKAPGSITPKRYEDIILVLLKQKSYESAAVWCERLAERFPEELCSYKCRARLFYSVGDRDRLFGVLDELRQRDIAIDAETAEFIRVFR